jgi:hypothetical protein
MNDNIVLRWNTALLQAVRATNSKPPVVARAIAMVHTAMYDAWAHYDDVALAVYSESIRRVPTQCRSEDNKIKAISYAAFRVLSDLFPVQFAIFDGLMRTQVYDILLVSRYDDQLPVDPKDLTPEQIGNTAAFNLLNKRKQDNSNQVNNYEDPMKDYQPFNDPEPAKVKDINRWQPLTDKKTVISQQFLYPHWGWITPFVFKPGRDLSEVQIPVKYPRPLPISPDEDEEKLTQKELGQAVAFEENCRQVIQMSRDLNDTTKTIAEYWADGPGSETPPGHWCLLARAVSLRDCLDLNDNIKLFFALGNTLFDASIACWRLKVEIDFCRPVSAIHTLFEGKEETFWGGPYQLNVLKPANEAWRSYLATPAFAEFPSGHSTFSASAATVLRLFTGTNYFGYEVTIPAGSSKIEPGMTPAHDITLEWQDLSDAAEQAGLSRMIGGIHFLNGNEEGLKLGRKLGHLVWDKVQQFWNGSVGNGETDPEC